MCGLDDELLGICHKCVVVGFGYVLVKGGIGDYTAQELFMPEETKAKYQREMVEELRRANDLKEKENQ
jgi:hypothetical protein